MVIKFYNLQEEFIFVLKSNSMKIFTCSQIKEIDRLTIVNEPVSPAGLMERAARQLFGWISERFEKSNHFLIFAGPGNNGGDGLALARMLWSEGYNVSVYFVNISSKTSDSWEINRSRLEKETSVPFHIINQSGDFPDVQKNVVIIDAVFGSGLTKPVEGLAAEVIQKVNKLEAVRISVDIPSGLFGEDNSVNKPENIINAHYTLSFQFPKLSFMFAENSRFVGDWHVLPIGLHDQAIKETETIYSLIEKKDISSRLRKRGKFDHKGIYGHGLLVAGSYGKMGAAILGATAALRTGAGLLTCHAPRCGINILQTALPEAMVYTDPAEEYISKIPPTTNFNAVGIGPGIGTDKVTQAVFYNFLIQCNIPLVIDADGINILGLNRDWLSLLPENTILTPHPKEFERIAGKTGNSYERLIRQTEFSRKLRCYIVLKGAYTAISTPDGHVYFNPTGNPGMATAGSGDVLTGMIMSLLCQGYSELDACLTAVYLHGLAGDIAAAASGYEAVIATDIISNIGNAFNKIRSDD